MKNSTQTITRSPAFPLDKPILDRCHNCTGLGNFSLVEAVSYRLVEWKGHTLKHYFCREHSTVEPVSPEASKDEALLQRVRDAIATLEAAGEPFKPKDIYAAVKVNPHKISRTELTNRIYAIAHAATEGSRQRSVAQRISEAIAALEGRRLSVATICRKAQAGASTCEQYPEVKEAIANAVLRSGGRLPANWCEKRAS